MSIDWERFAERVPAGTRIRLEAALSHAPKPEGVLLENKPFRDHEKENSMEFDCLRVQLTSELMPTSPLVRYSSYFINNQWLTFDEVMNEHR